jgi:hypothetical protein
VYLAERDMEALLRDFPNVKNYPDVQDEIMSPLQDLKASKSTLQQSINDYFALDQFEHSIATVGTGTIREDFQARLANYAQTAGKEAKDVPYAERRDLWQDALMGRKGESADFKDSWRF